MEAGSQHRLPIGPGGALHLKLGQESGLFLPRLIPGRLQQLLLLRQLFGQQVTLFGELAPLLLLGTKGRADFAQLFLKSGIGL